MKYRTLGKTGLRVSIVGLGTMVHAGHFGPMKDSESLEAIETALELGVNFIDTSLNYRHQRSERAIGSAIAAVVSRKGFRREELVVCTSWPPKSMLVGNTDPELKL